MFLGTPEVAVTPLRALAGAGFDVVMVVSAPDRRRGRGGGVAPSPVKAAALELGLPVTDRVDDVIAAEAELGVVVAYGRILRPHVLAAVPMVNLHFSLLPRWRGAAPVERAILAGDEATGVCLMEVDEGLDTGPVHGCEPLAIWPEETADELRARLAVLGTDLLLRHLASGLRPPRPQEGEATYAAKIDPAELRIDWGRSTAELYRLVRLGRAWTTFRGRRLMVLRSRPRDPAGLLTAAASGQLDGTAVATGDGWLELVDVKQEGRSRQRAAVWRHGAQPRPGECLGSGA